MITWSACIGRKRSVPRSDSRGNLPTSLPVPQIARAKAVKAEFIRKAEQQAQEGRKAADILADGVIVGVGLIQRDKPDSKH